MQQQIILEQEAYPKVSFQSVKSLTPIYQDEFDIPWEVDVFKDILEEQVYPRLHVGDKVRIEGALSEEIDVRDDLCAYVQKDLEEIQVLVEDIQVLCAYKQGISWIQESVIPYIRENEAKVEQIEISFKPFLPEGITDWGDESGAVPKYLDLGSENPDAWFDLPIRFLQELYPIEDIIEEALGVSRENVIFKLADEEQGETYLLKAFAKEEVIYSDSYDVSVSERPYMDECLHRGKVHPSTGYIKVFVNGQVLLDSRIKTDVEHVWDLYQNSVLPKVYDFIHKQTGGELALEKQPFFAELNMDITLSEPDYRLDSREDLISTLDALHEDMYYQWGAKDCWTIYER